MQQLLFILVLAIGATPVVGQTGIGIGPGPIHSSAIVDLSKSNKGVLVPRLTQTARLSIIQPPGGLIVYDTTTNRFYQYQENVWRYLLNNSYWGKSTSHNYITSLDSVGIGNSSPDARLEVTGNIRCRDTIIANTNTSAGNLMQGVDLSATGNLTASGTLTVGGDINTDGDLIVDNSNGITQIKNAGQNKVFVQASGDDLRLGTNSGNTNGKTIIRMNGADIISIDTTSTLRVLIGGSGGNVTMGSKLCRLAAPDQNMSPILYGRVFNNNSEAWMSTNGTITRTGVGTYEVETYSGRVTARSSIVATVAGQAPLSCSAVFMNIGVKFKIEVYNLVTGLYVDADFSFMVFDPANLFN